jgi:hypothetical protein
LDKKYRHELKFIISCAQAEILKYKLSLLMDVDTNSSNEDNTYFIRSLYFDDVYNSAYYEKVDGLEKREKYRIRIYNFDDSFIRLERKEKNRDLTHKEQTKLTKEECNNILKGNYDLVDTSKCKLLEDFVLKQKLNDIKPDVIVDYRRLAYTYDVEDVRVTFDENIKSGRFNYDLFDKDILTFDVLEPNESVLEVKFNNYIPNHIAKVIMTIPSIRLAISKFALCKDQKEV